MKRQRRHNPQSAEEKPATQQRKEHSEKESTNRHVYVEPGVQIDLVHDLKKKCETAQSENTAHNKKQLFWTKVAAGLVLLYTGFSGWQGYLTKQTYDASQRPFVGVNGIQPSHEWVDAKGLVQIGNRFIAGQTTSLGFVASIKNFGPVPGENFRATWKVFHGGIRAWGSKIPDHPRPIFPTQEVYLTGAVRDEVYRAIMRDEQVLEIEVTAEYDGAKHYTDCNKYQYETSLNQFLSLGTCTY